MKNIIVILVFLISGLAMAQTTRVVLEDQCNCEVLRGTAVMAAGMTTPAGADVGDIYVNTNTGTIYFWDGGSWELTSKNTVNARFEVLDSNLVMTDSDNNTVSVPVADIAAQGDDGLQSLVLTTPEAAGANCADGGVRVDTGIDDNDNGTLEPGEIDDTEYVCDGAKGDEGDPATDDQDLSLIGDILSLTGDPTSTPDIDLSVYRDNTDDQFDDEVNLRTPIDVDDAGKTIVTNETTVQEVIQAIAPITSKAARIFYPPSIAVDASTTGTGRTINLYTQYTAQFATPAVASAGAPTAIPTYAAGDLYYYVTYCDTSVFDNVSVNASGVMTYDVIAPPADYNSLINVVFVVK